MARLLIKRTLAGWVPADEASQELAKRYVIGETYRAEIVRPRSAKALSRYWVLVELILSNSRTFKSKEQLHNYLKIRAGHCTPIVAVSTGEEFLVPDSIDFDTLEEAEFQEVWRRVIDVVLVDILPGVDEFELELEIQKLIGVAR